MIKTAFRALAFAAGWVALAAPAGAQGFKLDGPWWTPLGMIKFSQQGTRIIGKMAWKCGICPFKGGEEVLRGILLEDSLSGQVRYCLKGKKGCKGDGWAPMVLLVAREGKVLSGAAHFTASECKLGGKGDKDGMVMRKVRPQPKKPKPPPPPKPADTPDAGTVAIAPDGGTDKAPPPDTVENPDKPLDEGGQPVEPEVKPVDPQTFAQNRGTWDAAMREGKELMDNGYFERARKKFLEATELDPTRPEAFNGIGVTYYGRNDFEEALGWYKKALEVDPNFGDAYYNMACIYALLKKNALAFRYLHIAVLNGFVQPEVMEGDPDLNNLRQEPKYQEILRSMRAGGKGTKP
jgi:hypothetical protein